MNSFDHRKLRIQLLLRQFLHQTQNQDYYVRLEEGVLVLQSEHRSMFQGVVLWVPEN